MGKREFGKLVQSLREEHRNDADDKWTQDDLARASGLGGHTVGKIERGERANLTDDELLRLADALQLTSNERHEFFLAACGVDRARMSRSEVSPSEVLAELVWRLDHIQLPAFVCDSYGDVLALNDAVLRLYGVTMDIFDFTSAPELARHNYCRLVYSPEFEVQRSLMGERWPRFSRNVMITYRQLSFRHRSSDYFKRLLRELKRYPLFRRTWDEIHNDEKFDMAIDKDLFEFKVPQVGHLIWLGCAMTAVTAVSDLKLYVLAPGNPTTTKLLGDFLDAGKPGSRRTRAAWPKGK